MKTGLVWEPHGIGARYCLHVEGYFADAIRGNQLLEQLKVAIHTARKAQSDS
jgi:hypothetical protein